MSNLSLRGVDAPTLARIQSSARRRKVSVNRLIVETLRQHFGVVEKTYDDLDALAGTWSKADGAAFDAAVAPFAEVDPGLWAAEPPAVYRAKTKTPARRAKSR